jgi:hypothetical protein
MPLNDNPMRVLVCELSGHHEECLPAVAHTLSSAAPDFEVLVNSRSLDSKGDIFGHFVLSGRPVQRLYEPSRYSLSALADLANSFDALYLNTLNPSHADFFARLRVPLIVVCHNFDEIYLLALRQLLEANRKSHVVTLWDHVKESLLAHATWLQRDRVLVHYSVAKLRPAARPSPNDASQLSICVPGRINFRTRDYGALAFAVRNLPDTSKRSIRLLFPGGCPDSSIAEFISLFGMSNNRCVVVAPFLEHRANPRRHAIFSSTHDEYYSLLSEADIVLPLTRRDSRYFTRSITSAIPTALSAMLPMALAGHEACIYKVPHISLPEDFHPRFISTLLDGSGADSASVSSTRLAVFREDLMSTNRANMRALLNRIAET